MDPRRVDKSVRVRRRNRLLNGWGVVLGCGTALAAHPFLMAQVDAPPDIDERPLILARLPNTDPLTVTPAAFPAAPSIRDQALRHALDEAHVLRRLGTLRLTPAAQWVTNHRAVQRVRPAPEPETWRVALRLTRQTEDGRFKSGEAYAQLPVPLDLSQRRWRMTGQIRIPRELIGNGPEEYLTPMRARWVMRDTRGRRCFGPNTGCSLLSEAWVPVAALVPTRDAPIPKGLMEEGFDLSQVAAVGFNIEAGNVSQGVEVTARQRMRYRGTVFVRRLRLEPLADVQAADPAPVPLYPSEAAEQAAAPHVRETLRRRLGLQPGEMGVLVNMAWPFRNRRYHTYGTSLGLAPWGDHWGFSSPLTEQAVRDDLRFLKAQGIRVVRVFLFGDLRAGLEYDAAGTPVAFSRLVYQDMAALLQAARQEQMLLIPSLLDFLVADGVTHEGPGLRWAVGEHPELLANPRHRDALVRLLVKFVRAFDGPDVLMWELMNEPDNAVAVVTTEHFNSLRRFLADLAYALHRHGILTTLGARHVGDYQRFWRGYVDVPQVHHWRLLESVPNPYPVETPARELGPLPAIVGEVEPVAPEAVGPLLDRLRDAGYLMAGFWSLRGHDGYAFKPAAPAVKRWIDAQARRTD